MHKLPLLFCLLSTAVLTAQSSEEPLANPQIKGILLVDNETKVRENNLDAITGVQFDGVVAPGGNDELIAELSPFLSGFPLTEQGAKDLSEKITAYYQKNNNPLVAASVPEQEMSQGVVQVVLDQARLGQVNVRENKYTSPDQLKQWVSIAPSEKISEKAVAKDLGWINSNPYRSVKASYRAGEQPGSADIDLIVSDKKNWKMLSGVDNTGTQPIGPMKFFVGFNTNNFLFPDHTLVTQFTTANHYSEYQLASAQYTAPLPWRNTLRLFGTYKATSPNRAEFPQKHKKTFQASTRYAVPLWFDTNALIDQVTFDVGFDLKGTNIEVLHQNKAEDAAARTTLLGQFTSSVVAERKRNADKIIASAELVGSPAEMIENTPEGKLSTLRKGAATQYLYSRLALSWERSLTAGWKLFLQGKSQLSLSNLVPSEQCSLGGVNTIRGYEDGCVNGDSAFYGNLELRSPTFAVVGIFAPQVEDSLSVVAFADAGHARYNTAIDNTPMQKSIFGVGPGIRYSVASYLTSRLDVGFPIDEQGEFSSPHAHFNAVFSY